MTPQQIPRELVDLLDERAGRKHSADGQVLRTLAEILTRYDQLTGRTAAVEPEPGSP